MMTQKTARTSLMTAVAAASVAAVVLVLAVTYRSRDNEKISDLAKANCQSIEHLKSYAYGAAVRAESTLPTLAYYKEHPEELRDALVQVQEQQRFFAPKPC